MKVLNKDYIDWMLIFKYKHNTLGINILRSNVLHSFDKFIWLN